MTGEQAIQAIMENFRFPRWVARLLLELVVLESAAAWARIQANEYERSAP